jgi:DNA-binding GntR family transcriptional regulator
MLESQPRHRTLRSWVYENLTERIVTGVLEPGAALVETQLASEMGVSRSPLREALRQLAQDGLVITSPNTGTIVAPVYEEEIDQIFEMRDLLESCLVAHAATMRTEEELAEARALLQRMEQFIDGPDIPNYAESDSRFHTLLWTMGKRPLIRESMQSVANQARRYLAHASRTLQTESPSTLRASHEEHLAVLTAIEGRDPDAAVKAIRHHMEQSRYRILTVFREPADGPVASSI